MRGQNSAECFHVWESMETPFSFPEVIRDLGKANYAWTPCSLEEVAGPSHAAGDGKSRLPSGERVLITLMCHETLPCSFRAQIFSVL